MHQRKGEPVHTVAALLAVLCFIADLSPAAPFPATNEMSMAEVAQKLANPNSPLATLTFKNQYTFYNDPLPGTNIQGSYAMTFQPSFPFRLADGSHVFFRPTIPVIFDSPVFDAGGGRLDRQSGLGDISFDLTYGRTKPSGVLWSLGMSSTLPTATRDDLGGRQWTLGPRAGLGYIKHWGVLAVFPTQQWNVAGWADSSTSATTIDAIATLLPGKGWAVGSSPILVYNWNRSQWTVPLDLTISRTVRIGKTPVKLGLTIDYYVEQPDRFGPKWMIGFNVAPVVKNIFAEWFQ